MRVVLDTNVLLSSLLRHDSVPSQLVQAWSRDRFVLLTHEMQITELRVASRRAHIRSRIRPAEAGKLVNELREAAVVLDRLPHVNRSTDPLDDYLLALCEAGHADFLVTGDKAGLLVLGTHAGTTILTARMFLDRLVR
jgi:putative PIN family toxin of toxin-antitoxin system